MIKFHKIVGSNVPGLSSFVAFYNEVFSSSILDLERVNDLAMDMNINEKSKQDNFYFINMHSQNFYFRTSFIS